MGRAAHHHHLGGGAPAPKRVDLLVNPLTPLPSTAASANALCSLPGPRHFLRACACLCVCLVGKLKGQRYTTFLFNDKATSAMGQSNSTSAAPATEAKKEPTCKICCACPSERRARDECTLLKNVDQCEQEINAFYACLLKEGFSQEEVDGLRRSTKRM